VRVGEVEEEESAVGSPSRELGGPPSLDFGGHVEEEAWGLANLTGGGGAERRTTEEEVWGSAVRAEARSARGWWLGKETRRGGKNKKN